MFEQFDPLQNRKFHHNYLLAHPNQTFKKNKHLLFLKACFKDRIFAVNISASYLMKKTNKTCYMIKYFATMVLKSEEMIVEPLLELFNTKVS